MKSTVKPVRFIPNETSFERQRDRIDLEASHAADHLYLLKGLMESRKDYYLEMNESNTFWHLTFKAHLDAVLSHLCRLYDRTRRTLSLGKFLRTVKANPALFSDAAFRERLKDNPHVDTLYRALDSSELDEELASVSDSDPLVKKLLDIRKQSISHIDAERVINNEPVTGLTAHDIETLLSRARAITSKYSLFYRASAYGGIVGADDYKSTLQWLRKALSAHQTEVAEEMQRAAGQGASAL
jgi:hypothetical protein